MQPGDRVDNPPWQADAPADAEATGRAARAFWVTTITIAVVLAALGIRRDQVPVYHVERTTDPLVLFAWPDSCQQNARVRVTETDSTVTVTANRDRFFCGGVGACQDIIEVRLDQPLGDRQVIDGDTGKPISVGTAEGPP